MSGSLKSVAKYNLHLVQVYGVGWDRDVIEPENDYNFTHGKGNASCHFGMGFIIHKGIR
jgi:hypothetical protein